MTDFLAYRIPGELRVEKIGILEELAIKDEFEGFIFSDFTGNKQFRFVEKEGVFDKWHVHGDIPEVITKEEYLRQVQGLIQQMRTGAFEKVVYSRVKSVSLRHSNLIELFDSLTYAFPHAFVYLLSSEKVGTWIGASPEVLLSRKNHQAVTHSLAGTKPISDPTSWTAKERKEQSYVTEHIEHILTGVFKFYPSKEGPFEVEAGPVKHLRTNILFSLSREHEKSFLSMVHPTPAVSGTPVATAISILTKTERHERELYGGFFGLFEEHNTCCYVNLRCCRIIGDQAFLYVGGGITEKSNSLAEWEETEHKSLTLTTIIS